jgi:hypothetical protein
VKSPPSPPAISKPPAPPPSSKTNPPSLRDKWGSRK